MTVRNGGRNGVAGAFGLKVLLGKDNPLKNKTCKTQSKTNKPIINVFYKIDK